MTHLLPHHRYVCTRHRYWVGPPDIDQPATGVELNAPTGVGIDYGGDIYICDTGNNRIRFVDASDGTISS